MEIPGRDALKWTESVPMIPGRDRRFQVVRRERRRERPSIEPMPRAKSFSARIYATPEYREGYVAGCKAVHLQRPVASPYLIQDLRHLGWIDAIFDAWSARRVEISRAADCREIFEARALTDAESPPAGQIPNR